MRKSFFSMKTRVERKDGKKTSFSFTSRVVVSSTSITTLAIVVRCLAWPSMPGLLDVMTRLVGTAPPSVANELPPENCEPTSERQSMALTDGSTIELNSDACVVVLYSDTKRLVKLVKGEAVFQVKHDPTRPFVVKSGATSIVDVGTRFDAYRREGRTRIAVTEGRVNLYHTPSESLPSARQTPQPLSAGHMIDVPDDVSEVSLIRSVKPDDISRMTAWLEGKIVEDRLGDFLNEFARYHDVKFVAADPRILNIPIGGRYSIGHLNDFLEDLERSFCIRHASSPGESGKRVVTLKRIGSAATGDHCQ